MNTQPLDLVLREHPRRAYWVVDDFEAELCSYTGAPFAVAVNSCTNALFLALTWSRRSLFPMYMQRTTGISTINPALLKTGLCLPRRTYIGVLQSCLNAGYEVKWRDGDWQELGFYRLDPTLVTDCARDLRCGAYDNGHECLSFHSAKQLPIGRGGAILTDDEEAAEWFRAARMDGRAPGDVRDPVFPAFHCPCPPDVAARGLDILSRWNDKGYSPPPLPHEDYPDLSQWWP